MIAWSSTDGIHWTKAPEVAVFVGSDVYAIAAGPVPLRDGATTPGVVAVGSSGDVEDDIPAAWLSPAR